MMAILSTSILRRLTFLLSLFAHASLLMPLLSQTEREQVLVEICAAICTMLKLLDGPEDDDGLQFTQTVLHLLARAQAVRDSLQPPQLGRGCADLTLPPLAQPKSEMYEFAVMRPERFVELVRFTPIEFEDLHTEVLTIRVHISRAIRTATLTTTCCRITPYSSTVCSKRRCTATPQRRASCRRASQSWIVLRHCYEGSSRS